MAITVNTTSGNSLTVTVSGTTQASFTTDSTSVSVTPSASSSVSILQKGPKGDTGPQGIQGVAGNDGVDGQDGADGADGSDGTGFTGGSYSSSTGVVTFTSNDGLGFSTSDLRGADGQDGQDGQNGTNGADGADGADGQGVPTGGSIGQIIVKTGSADYATAWGNQPSDPVLPLANISGRYMWSSTDDGERVLTGNTVYGPYNWYSFSNEPLAFSQADQMRNYSGSEISGTTTGTMYGYYLFAFGAKNPYSGKKIRVDYSFRVYYSGSTAPTSGTPFGVSLWSSNAQATGSATSVQATYRAESDDHTYGGTTQHHHGSFTTSSALNDDYLIICAEHRSSTGLNSTTYMPANISIYAVD